MGGTLLVIGLLLGLSLLVYRLWMRSDTQREAVALGVIQDLDAMGELVPASLHPQVDPVRCIGSGSCVAACPEKTVIALVGGRARLANPLGCVGHGACASACPVGAIRLVYGSRTRGVELPQLDPFFETQQSGVYVVGELGGMGLIRNAVNQGRQAAERIIAGNPQRDLAPRRGQGDALDAIIVGAGPAGISATLALLAAGLKVLLIERDRFGGTIMHYPRAKVVMTGDLEFPLYGRVRRAKMSKEELIRIWQDILTKIQPPLVTGQTVEQLAREQDDMWCLRTDHNSYRAANVVLALGVRGSPRKLQVPGEETKKVAYGLLEPAEYADKHVLIVGGGNSAVETALALSDFGGCRSVTISYRGAVFARCRGDNRSRIEALLERGAVQSALETEVNHIADTTVELRTKDGDPRTIENDAVIIQVGGTPPAKLLKSFGIALITKYGEE